MSSSYLLLLLLLLLTTYYLLTCHAHLQVVDGAVAGSMLDKVGSKQ